MQHRTDCQVYIVEDDPSVQRGLKRLLKAHGYAPRAFSSATEFIDSKLPCNRVGCILLDVNMPEMNGMELQDQLLDRGVKLPIIFITGQGTVPMSVRAMKKGALDFLEKPIDSEVLLTVVDNAMAVSRQWAAKIHAHRELEEKVASLTPRERQIFQLVVKGMLNRQIAHQLGIVEKTVKVHRAHIMSKLEAKSVTDLVRISEKLFQLSNSS